jgi:hypothetical protein
MSKQLSRRELLRLGVLGGVGGLAAAYLPTHKVMAQGQATKPSLSQTMASATVAFLDALDANARTKATYAFSNEERFRWHWTTPAGFPRNGLPLREMNDSQQALALALLRTGSSEVGYKKMLDIMSLQKDLGNDPLNYFVTAFGTPGTAEPWGWRFEGHHISRQFTIIGEKVALTPFFLGSWPTINGAKLRAMPREEDAGRELARSLEGRNRETGIFQASTLGYHVTSNQAKVEPIEQVGISYDALSTNQQNLVMEIIQTYLGVLPEEISKEHLARIEKSGLDKIRFGWAGNLEPRRPYYYRIQGPSFLMEHDNSRNGGTHIHSVWRVFDEDFGYHLL